MAKKQIIQQRFDGGIALDPREQSTNKVAYNKHCDLHTYPNKVSPIRTMSDGSSGGDKIGNLLSSVTDGKLYGLGVVSATTKVKLFEKSDPTSATAWAASTSGASTTIASLDYPTFIEYQGLIYGMHGSGRYVWSYNPATDAFTESAHDAAETASVICNGIIAADANLYIPRSGAVSPTGQQLLKFTGSTWSNASLVLPSTEYITSLENFGKFLAILTTTTSSGTAYGQTSKIYLWNLVSSDPTEVIQLGDGIYRTMGILDGRLIAIGVNYSFVTPTNVKAAIWSGGSPDVRDIISNVNKTTSISTPKQIRENKLYFTVNDGDASGLSNHGIWTINRNLVTSQEIKSYRDGESGIHNAFRWTSDMLWVSQNNSNYYIAYTASSLAYGDTSIIETIKYNGGDINKRKKLVGVAVSTAYLPTAGQIVLKYKADSDTGFNNTIFTNTADNSVSREGITIESTGKNLPEFNEIQFRIESTGGAEITGIKFVYDDEPKNLLSTK